MNRLDDAEAALIGDGNALLDAVQRSQGAALTGSAGWVKRQDRAAVRYAKQLAGALRAVSNARARLSRAMRASRLGRIRVSTAVLRRTQARLRRRGLPAGVVRGLRRLGLSRNDVARYVKSLSTTPATPETLSAAYARPTAQQALNASATLSNDLAGVASCAAGS
jgi:hypothetical protein